MKSLIAHRGVHARALLADDRLELRNGVTVARWAHGDQVFIGDRTELYGRLTAERAIAFRNRAVFQRINAPVVQFDALEDIGPPERRPAIDKLTRFRPRRASDQLLISEPPLRTVVLSSFSLPNFSVFKGDLVVRGKLKIGEGCLILGSIKAHDNILIGRRTRVTGSIISRESVFVGANCAIKGLVVGERKVRISRHVTIGGAQRPSTVTADDIRLSPGTAIFGTIWARRLGRANGNT